MSLNSPLLSLTSVGSNGDYMSRKKVKSGLFISLKLTERIIEKLIVIFLSSSISFCAGTLYSNQANSGTLTSDCILEKLNYQTKNISN